MNLRAMMLAILVLALALGGGNYVRRRLVVDDLLAVVPTGILLEVGPTIPGKDPTHEPDRGRYLTALHRVRERRAEPLAGAELAEALRAARRRGDKKSMRGSLAALQWLGPESRRALPEIVRTARGEDSIASNDQGATQIRNLAIHVLGILAHDDDDAFAVLMEILRAPDASFQRTVSSSAANELGGLGSRAGEAVSALVEAIRTPYLRDPPDLLRGSALWALARIGPEAEAAIPMLAEIANDMHEPLRHVAVTALGEIRVGLHFRGIRARQRGGGASVSTPSFTLAGKTLEGLLGDRDPTIREEARWQSRRLRRRELANSR